MSQVYTLASLKVFIFWTNSVSDLSLALAVTTLMNWTPKTQLLLTINPEDFFSVLRGIIHEVPDDVLAVWNLWVTAHQVYQT
uniref:Uncharacterized protein n=1 Tax=Oryza punctata TaxID=4537 RepID=A0A0E0M8T2_ORYPU